MGVRWVWVEEGGWSRRGVSVVVTIVMFMIKCAITDSSRM